jgi:monoamine oxidase
MPHTVRASAVVVGAGVAGLAAAVELCKAGITRVVVLEAGNRVGGRCWTHQENGLSFKMGAQVNAQL